MIYEDLDTLLSFDQPVDFPDGSLLCTFTYRRRCYAIIDMTRDGGRDSTVCRPLRFTPAAGGWVDAGRPAPHEADVMAARLLRRADAAPGRYELCGEHYRVTDGDKPGSFRVRVCRPRTVGVTGSRSAAIRFCFFAMLSILYLWLYIRQTDMEWVRAVLPSVPKYPLTVLFFVLSLSASVGLYLLLRKDRDIFDAVLLIICPPHVFSVIGALTRLPAIRVILPALFVFTFMFFALPLPITSGHITFGDVLTALRLAAAMSILLTCVLLPLSDVLGMVPEPPYTETESRQIGEVEAAFAAVSERLRDGNWGDLTTEEKVETLQAVVDYEAVVTLGVQPPTVIAEDIARDTVEGTYSHTNDTITVDISVLEWSSADRAVDTVLHELRHAWQYAMADLYERMEEAHGEDAVRISVMRDAHDYRYEFDHYQTSETSSYYAYYHQKVETDSREFADQRIREFYRYLIMQQAR